MGIDNLVSKVGAAVLAGTMASTSPNFSYDTQAADKSSPTTLIEKENPRDYGIKVTNDGYGIFVCKEIRGYGNERRITLKNNVMGINNDSYSENGWINFVVLNQHAPKPFYVGLSIVDATGKVKYALPKKVRSNYKYLMWGFKPGRFKPGKYEIRAKFPNENYTIIKEFNIRESLGDVLDF